MNTDNVPQPGEVFNYAQHLLELNQGRADKIAYIDDQGELSFGELDARACAGGGVAGRGHPPRRAGVAVDARLQRLASVVSRRYLCRHRAGGGQYPADRG